MEEVIANNKRIAKNTLLLYFRMFINIGISLYSSRIILSALGETDFGIYDVVGGFVSLFAVIQSALASATQRFLSFEIGKKGGSDITSVFSTALVVHIIIGVLLALFVETIGYWFLVTKMNIPGDRIIASRFVFHFSVVSMFVNIVSIPYNAAIIAYEKMAAFAYVSIFEAAMKLCIATIVLYTTSDKLILYSLLIVLLSIVIRLIYGTYVKKNFHECYLTKKFNKYFFKDILSFTGWNIFGAAAGVLKDQGVNVLLNIFFGAKINASRAVAYQVMNAVYGFVNNFQTAMGPQITKYYSSDAKDQMLQLVFQGSRFSFILVLLLACPLIIEAPYILNLWLSVVPEYAVVFTRFVLIVIMIDSLSFSLSSTMLASGKVRDYQIVVGSILLFTVPIIYVMFKNSFGPVSAFSVLIIMAFLGHLARLFMLNKSIGFPWLLFFRRVTLRSFLLLVMSMALPMISYWLLPCNFISFILVCTICIMSVTIFSFFIGLNNSERLFVRNRILNFIKNKCFF